MGKGSNQFIVSIMSHFALLGRCKELFSHSSVIENHRRKGTITHSMGFNMLSSSCAGTVPSLSWEDPLEGKTTSSVFWRRQGKFRSCIVHWSQARTRQWHTHTILSVACSKHICIRIATSLIRIPFGEEGHGSFHLSGKFHGRKQWLCGVT